MRTRPTQGSGGRTRETCAACLLAILVLWSCEAPQPGTDVPSQRHEGAIAAQVQSGRVGEHGSGEDGVPRAPDPSHAQPAQVTQGSASRTSAAAADEDGTSGAAFIILGPAPEDPTFAGLSAADLEPLVAGVQRWVVIEGDDRGTEFARTLSATDRFAATMADRWGERHTHYLRAGPGIGGGIGDGAGVEMPANTSHEDKATTLFDPPLGMAPALLQPGVPFVARSRMRVVDEQDNSKLRHLGRCERTITLLGRDLVRTPLGEMTAVRLKMEFRATLQLATASEIATLHVVPGLGVVAEDRRERINAMGIVNRTRRSVMVRAE